MLKTLKGSPIQYVCAACCDALGVAFNGLAANEVGRKQCRTCLSTGDASLHIGTVEEVDAAIAALNL